MTRPRFSVVIPTRERADTLHYTLQTCLAQQFDDYEIVVCDNCSSSATRQVIESFDSPNIHYVRSNQPLAMSDNWELAVSHAKGEYVIVFGDDDGLMPDALSDIDRVLKHTATRALRWERIYYSWPDILVPEAANIVHIPFIRRSEILDGRDIIRHIANYETDYTLLPMLYNSAIHSDLIRELKSRIGRVFAARSPDVFSGFAFAYLVGSYVSIGRPMSINAGSAKSNGVAHMYLQGNSPVVQEFHQLNDAAGLSCHPKVPNVLAVPAGLADNFHQAKDLFFPDDMDLCLDRKRLVTNCLNSLKYRKSSTDDWETQLNEIRRSLADDRNLLAWFDANNADHRPGGVVDSGAGVTELGFDGSTLHLNAAEFGATDVMGVAQLSGRLIGKMEQLPTFENLVTKLSAYRRLRTAARVLIKGK